MACAGMISISARLTRRTLHLGPKLLTGHWLLASDKQVGQKLEMGKLNLKSLPGHGKRSHLK